MTLLYTDVFSPNSKTWQFEKAVSRIKEDPRCTSLLGNSKEIKAYGEPTGNRWTRNRPIAYVLVFLLGLATLMNHQDIHTKRYARQRTYEDQFSCKFLYGKNEIFEAY